MKGIPFRQSRPCKHRNPDLLFLANTLGAGKRCVSGLPRFKLLTAPVTLNDILCFLKKPLGNGIIKFLSKQVPVGGIIHSASLQRSKIFNL